MSVDFYETRDWVHGVRLWDARKWVPCAECLRMVNRRWYHRWLRPRCGPEVAQVRRCAEIAAARHSEPPAWWFDPGLRPEDEAPPPDAAMCGDCGGSGEVFLRQDYETGVVHTTHCRPCQGTGYANGEMPWTHAVPTI